MSGRYSDNPGKRERQARKRHRRGLYWNNSMAAEAVPLKVGRKHLGRIVRNSLAVADSRNTGGQRALESARRSAPNLDLQEKA